MLEPNHEYLATPTHVQGERAPFLKEFASKSKNARCARSV